MKKPSIMRAYLYKLLRSPMFYIGIIGTTALCFFSRLMAPGRREPFGFNEVYNEYMLFINLDSMRKVAGVFAALPFASNFADEWTNKVTANCVTRCGAGKYARSNVILCFVSAFVTVFVGMMLFASILSMFVPVFDYYYFNGDPRPLENYNDLNYGIFIVEHVPMLYVVFNSAVFAASCAMWSVMGMLLSAFFPNKFVALCTPVVASYIVERITIQFPRPLNLYHVSISFLNWNNVWGQFLYSIGLFAALSVVLGILFVFAVKRKVQNELA